MSTPEGEMVVQPASVEDILSALHLGEDSAEPEVAAALRDRFGLADDADLAERLREVPPGEVLACIAAVAAPVAAMVRELYAWLAEIDGVRSTGNLSVRLSDDQMTALALDPEQYRAYEQAVVESVLKVGFDPSRLPAASPLYRFLDVHQPPDCVWSTAVNVVRCAACRPGVAAEFKRLEDLLRAAVESGAELTEDSSEQVDPHDPRSWFVRVLPRRVDELLARDGVEPCAYRRYGPEYLDQGLPDLAACFHEVTAEEIRRFFDMPYWKQRWQLFEVWLLHVILSSYGTTRWRPSHTGQTWDLKAGSTNPEPVATAGLANGCELRCYYQHESSPAGSLVPGARDRPELLITLARGAGQAARPGTDGEPVVLVVEAKARFKYKYQEMEGAVYPLLKWQPRWLLGASYFSLTGAERLHPGKVGDVELALGERVVPGSAATSAMYDWLRRMWNDVCGEHVTVIAVDISGSMGPSAPVTRLRAMATVAGGVTRPAWAEAVAASDRLYIATFGSRRPEVFPVEELSEGVISRLAGRLRTTRGTTPLRWAWHTWLDNLDSRSPCRSLTLHLVTDGLLEDDDIAMLAELDAAGHTIHIHLGSPGVVTYRELGRHQV